MSIPVWAQAASDENGARRLVRYHLSPGRLSAAQRNTADAEVPDADLTPPDHEPHLVPEPWLTSAGRIEWRLKERPLDDPAQLARKVQQLEARLNALERR